jgi:hypothetical protein
MLWPLTIALAAAALSLLTGCRSNEIVVPYDAPLMLSQDQTIDNPFVRINGQWVQEKGAVLRHRGAVVVLLPATQP